MIRTAAVVLAAAILAGCVTSGSWEATRVLRDIEAGAGPSALKERTPRPSRETVTVDTAEGSLAADLYHPRQRVGARLVLVPGFTPQGKDDRRLVQLAGTLARARFLVLVPDLKGTRTLSVRRDDADAIAEAASYLANLAVERAGDGDAAGVAAISYAVGLAVLASKQPEGEAAIDFLVGVGSYYDIENVITFTTTGAFQRPGSTPWQTLEPESRAKWIFLRGNLDAVKDARDRRILGEIAARRIGDPQAPIGDLAPELGAEARTLLDLIVNEERERVPALLSRLPRHVRRQIEALSLAGRDLSHLSGEAILIHGRADRMIPYSESERLAKAIGEAELHLIDGFSHIASGETGLAGQWQLIGAVMDILDRRRAP